MIAKLCFPMIYAMDVRTSKLERPYYSKFLAPATTVEELQHLVQEI